MFTQFYEDNAGGIHAVIADERNEVVNVLTHLEQSVNPGDPIKAALEGWPYASDYDPDDHEGMTASQLAADIVTPTSCANIATVGDLVVLYPEAMGTSALRLFGLA